MLQDAGRKGESGYYMDSSENLILNYTWNVIQINSNRMLFQLHFEQPLDVSREVDHYLQIKFIQNGYFPEKSTMQPISYGHTINARIPRQFRNDRLSQMLADNADAIKSSVVTAMNINIISNMLLSQTLQFLWGLINALQIIVRLPLFALAFPANVQVVFSIIIDITNFSFFDTKPMEEAVFTFTETDSLNSNFEAMGYQSMNLLDNMGLMFWYLPCIVLLYIVVGVFGYMIGDWKKGHQIYQFFASRIFFGLMIRYFLESYLEILITVFLQLKNIHWATNGDHFASISCIMLTIGCFIFPILVSYFLLINKSRLEKNDPTFYTRYDSLFLGLRPESSAALMLNPIFMLRRLIFVLTTHFLQNFPMLQVNLLLFQCLGMISYLYKARPYQSLSVTNLEIFNELAILAVSYPLLLFTGYMDAPADLQYDLGWVMILIILLNVLINCILMILETIRGLKHFFFKFKALISKKRAQWASSVDKYQKEQLAATTKQINFTASNFEGTTDLANLNNQMKNGIKRKTKTRIPSLISNMMESSGFGAQTIDDLSGINNLAMQQRPIKKKKQLLYSTQSHGPSHNQIPLKAKRNITNSGAAPAVIIKPVLPQIIEPHSIDKKLRDLQLLKHGLNGHLRKKSTSIWKQDEESRKTEIHPSLLAFQQQLKRQKIINEQESGLNSVSFEYPQNAMISNEINIPGMKRRKILEKNKKIQQEENNLQIVYD